MSQIMNLFRWRGFFAGPTRQSIQHSATGLGFAGEPASQENEILAFERLGASQQSIDHLVSDVIHGLSKLGEIGDQMASLRTSLAFTFDDHRELALENSSLKQEVEHTAQRLNDKISENQTIYAELQVLRPELDELRRSFENMKTHHEALEHRHHLLGMAKKEVEDILSRNVTLLASAQEDGESLRLELSAAQETADQYSVRLSDMTARYNEANDSSVLLMRRSESLENSLQAKIDELIGLKERFDVLSQEKDSAVLYSQQKDQESAHLRVEMAKLAQQSQQERKDREIEINQLRTEHDNSKAQVRMLEEINAQIRTENDQLSLQSRRIEDQSAQLEALVKHLESKVARLTSKLDSITSAKNQVEQSRSTMSARLEAVTQTLSEREGDVRRLEMEVTRLVAQMEKQAEASQDSIDSLHARNLELEKEISTQRKEAAYYASQLNGMQKSDAKLSNI